MAKPVAEEVPPQAELPEEEGEQAQQQIDNRTEKEKTEDDNAIYYVLEQMMQDDIEKRQKGEDGATNTQLQGVSAAQVPAEVPVEEKKIKIEPQETPVEEPKPVKVEQDLCKKRVRKGRSFSRRRHIYRRRSVIEPNTSRAAGKKDYPEFYQDDDEDEEKVEIEIKKEPEEGESSKKKIKIDKQEPKNEDLVE